MISFLCSTVGGIDRRVEVSVRDPEVRQRLGMVPPHAFSKATALFSGMDPSVVGMASASTRLSNRRIRQELGMQLRYPSFRNWLAERLGEPQFVEPELVASS